MRAVVVQSPGASSAMNARSVRDKIEAYRRVNFYRTAGYMNCLDAVLWREFLAGQAERGVSGSLAEIGVHHGRSFFLLASGRVDSEKCLAVDLFEDDALNRGSSGGRAAGFKNNCRKYGFLLAEDEILKGSSLELNAGDILRRVGRVRFFSVDGGHMYKHVANDLRLAEAVVAQGGIICVDDMFNPLWPEIPVAVFDWLRTTSSGFVPFVATTDKLYLCDPAYGPVYRAMIYNEKRLKRSVCRNVSVFSNEVTVLCASLRSKIIHQIATAGLPTNWLTSGWGSKRDEFG